MQIWFSHHFDRSRLIALVVLTILAVIVAPVPTTHAATVLYARPSATGTGDCLSWANACTVQAALTNAVSGDEIWVMTGTHKPAPPAGDRAATFQLKNGVVVYGGFPNTGNPGFADRNPAANVTVLSGDLNGDDSGFTNNGENSYHVVTGATGATLDGVTISGGNANGSNPYDRGGGMLNNTTSPTLTNIIFSGNSATIGGGMYNDSSSPTLTNVTFSGNSAQYGGGGMQNYSNSNPTLTNVTLSGNSAQYGGGMFNSSSSPALTNVTFSGNQATTQYGGGMHNESNSSPNLTNVTFSGNSAAVYGGGMFNSSSSPTLTNVTFSGNSSNQWGGGMFNWASSPTLTNVTFSSNSTPWNTGGGGGMANYSSSNPQMRNNILWGNSGLNGPQIFNDGTSWATVAYSVVNGGCPNRSTCTDLITANPMLGSLGNYGGSTQTIPLLPGSSAIDATIYYCPAADQRSITRSSPACDIGAFESQGFTLAITSGNNQSAPITIAFAQPLALTVAPNAASEPVDGGRVTFTAPSSGASTNPTTNIATITGGGVVSQSVTANGTVGGPYNVTASATGATAVTFNLENTSFVTVLYAIPGGATSAYCDSWANACELRYALTRSVSGQEIWVKAGAYKPTDDTNRSATFQLKNGVAIYGGFAMTETLRSQRNPATNVVTLSGDIGTPGDNGDNSYHVVTGATGATLDGVTVSDGNANGSSPNNRGGGMFNYSASPTLTNVTFSDNSATDAGGGVNNDQPSNPTLTNVTFSGNMAYQGGGLANWTNSNVTLMNVTFSGNSGTRGGGMFNYNAHPTLMGVTFSGNSASEGGGMHNRYSSPQVQNSVLWGNTAPSGAQIYNYGTPTPTVTYSVVQGGYAGGIDIITANPLLGSLSNYGGSTQTFPLLPGSPAIDATSTNCPTTDQRGVTRSSPTCDIGAYESRGFTFTNLTGTPQSATINTAFANPLALNVTSAVGEPVNGGQVILTAPTSGASIAAATPITLTIANGAVSQSVTANGTTGSYNVTASASGVSTPAQFALTNIGLADLVAQKANDVGGAATIGNSFNWTITVTNTSANDAAFADTQVILRDNLPSSGATYGTPAKANLVNMTQGGNNISCAIVSNDLTCTASGASVTIGAGGHFDVVIPVTPTIAGALANPHSGGVCHVDPDTVVTESNESNNDCANSVTVNNPAPTLVTMSPTSANADGAAFTLTVTGTNFVSNSVVHWNGVDRVTSFVSATQLGATIPGTDIAATGIANITVFNPTPGGGTSNSLPFIINPANTTTTLQSSANPSAPGQAVTFTATVNENASGTPTGTVTFYDNGAVLGTGTLNASTVATFTTSSISVGTHPITATYAGDTNFNGSSGTLTQNVSGHKCYLPWVSRSPQ